MKVLTHEAIQMASESVRSLLSQHCPVDDSSTIYSLLMYDESIGAVALRPSHVKHGDGYAALNGQIQESCKAVVVWTEIDDPRE